jgi:hypothetical protein
MASGYIHELILTAFESFKGLFQEVLLLFLSGLGNLHLGDSFFRERFGWFVIQISKQCIRHTLVKSPFFQTILPVLKISKNTVVIRAIRRHSLR